MMGRLKSEQGQLFYQFQLGDAVPEDHLVRKIDATLDLSWLRSELAPHYSSTGRPSIDPELMIRMLIVVRSRARRSYPPRSFGRFRIMTGYGIFRLRSDSAITAVSNSLLIQPLLCAKVWRSTITQVQNAGPGQ